MIIRLFMWEFPHWIVMWLLLLLLLLASLRALGLKNFSFRIPCMQQNTTKNTRGQTEREEKRNMSQFNTIGIARHKDFGRFCRHFCFFFLFFSFFLFFFSLFVFTYFPSPRVTGWCKKLKSTHIQYIYKYKQNTQRKMCNAGGKTFAVRKRKTCRKIYIERKRVNVEAQAIPKFNVFLFAV